MNKIFKHNKLIILIIFIITVFFLFQIPKVKINNDIEVFLPKDNPAKESNNYLKDIFGESQNLVTAVKFNQGKLFDIENLKLIDNLTAEIEAIENVDEVTSLTNVDFIAGSSEGMQVEELIKNLPENETEVLKIKEKLLSWDYYRNNLYSDDFKSTQILITPVKDLSTEEESQIYYDLKKVVSNYQSQEVNTYISGSTAINTLMGNQMLEDVRLLIPFVFIVLIIALYFFFRKKEPVILVMITVIVSTIISVGLMAYLGINLTLVSTVIPVLLLAVGSAYGIHILSHYYDDLAKKKKINEKQIRETIISTVENLGKPVFLAALTTVVGFSSLASSKIVPIKSFGIFTAIGIVVAFIVAIFLIPSIIILTAASDKKENGDFENLKFFDSIIETVHKFYSKRRITVIILVLLVVAASLSGFHKIIIDTPLIEMFKEESQIRKADDFINNNFAGTNVMKVLIEGEERGSLNNPQILSEMDTMQQRLETNFSSVGKTSSISNFIKRMNQVMNYPEEENANSEEDSNSQTADVKNNNSEASSTPSSFYEKEETDDSGSVSSFYSEAEQDGNGSNNNDQNNNEQKSNNGTSSFYQEENKENNGSSSFYQGEEKQKEESAPETEVLAGPDKSKNISEYQLVRLLNRAFSRAKNMNLSAEEFLELVNKELNYQAASYYEIPNNVDKYKADSQKGLQNLISQYLLLYSGNVDDLINDQLEPDKAQMLIQISDPSNITAAEIKESINSYSSRYFPDQYQTTVSGYAAMALEANNLIVGSQFRSIIISFVVVFLIVALSFKSLVAGIYGIIPLGFSLIINFGLMGHFGIKLDVGTAMVASIAIGIGVDYTIHFLHGYHQNRLKSDDLNQVTKNTLTSSGKAIIFNAVSVALGFLVLLFSNFYPLVYLGLLIAVTMFTSSLAAISILPLLLNLFKPEFISKE